MDDLPLRDGYGELETRRQRNQRLRAESNSRANPSWGLPPKENLIAIKQRETGWSFEETRKWVEEWLRAN